MPSAFNFAASPFDALSMAERALVRDSVDVAYFRAGDTVLGRNTTPSHLFMVIKGHVQQFDGKELLHTYGPDDTFDGRGLVAGRVSSQFVAAEEVLAYQLARQTVTELIASNATFGALLFSDLSNKLGALSQRHSRHEMQSLSMARVDEVFLRPVHEVDASTSIYAVAGIFHEHRVSSVMVRDAASTPPRLGIFTTTGLQRAILDGTPLTELPVGQLTSFNLISVHPGDAIGDALTTMIRHKVHRVVVTEARPNDASGHRQDDHIVGVLEALDVFSFLSNHSYLINLQISEAKDLDALRSSALQITRLISILQRSGTKVNMIATLVQELNAKLFERAWHLIAPAELVANSCLFVMGSEGRGEQLLKTDQDNGLVLRDGYTPPADLAVICAAFSQALADFGYPECPGRIMVSNPQWRQSTSQLRSTVRRWLMMPDADGLMALAIFIDAAPVCGDASLLEAVRNEIFALAADSDAMLARFASAIQLFDQGSGWWNRLLLRENGIEQLDLKKAAIFPLVHGVRSLALARRIAATGTAERVAALVAMDALPAALGTDLVDSLHFFMSLRLQAGLGEIEMGQPVSGGVAPGALSSLDRDLLKDTLSVVKRFKLLLRQRFHLDALG
jgi:CBS domain-containing protein